VTAIVGFVDCVEYGSVENMPGALIVLTFNYYAVKIFFRDSDGTIHITHQHQESCPTARYGKSQQEQTTKSVSAGMQLGVANYVEGNLGCAKEKQYKSIHYMHFHGSGEKTKRALWNAESGNRIGVAIVVQADGTSLFVHLRHSLCSTVLASLMYCRISLIQRSYLFSAKYFSTVFYSFQDNSREY